MKKPLILALALLLNTVFAQAGQLVMSPNLALNYPPPTLISHTSNTLILTYDHWSWSHSLVNPAEIYPKVDLTGIERQFVKSLFDPEIRETFPGWLRLLSQELAEQFGLPAGRVDQRTLPSAELFGTYSAKHGEGYLFLLDKTAIHRLTVIGSEENYKEVMKNIRER